MRLSESPGEGEPTRATPEKTTNSHVTLDGDGEGLGDPGLAFLVTHACWRRGSLVRRERETDGPQSLAKITALTPA